MGDVTAIGMLARVFIDTRHHDTNSQAQKFVNLTHPDRVTTGQVIVHRDDMHALARQGVQINGKRRDQGFPLTGFHFRDLALVQDHPTDQLNVKMPHAQNAPGGLSNRCESFIQDVVFGFTLC